ncbi:SMI1/KNR4 family protein [Actinomadura alba]|uniref:SMI1/KNR4 family protein n=1 Tax=Actinomadura alba TaxID=406431 RepID=A0ABR7LPQ0_9ACTN|nr:SMI1/KNR4 family protein [Actinomadura alba]MBC6466823.1 SMI1/KNR4 family protein [Actinomadura alba]
MPRFDDVKATFWDDESRGALAPVTDESVREAEAVLGVTLPSPLLDLLRAQNGGGVADEWCAFPTGRRTSWSDDEVPFDHLLGIGHGEGVLSLLDTPYLVEEWGLPSPVVLLSGDGHYWIGLDYRRGGPRHEPSVTWFDADLQTEVALAADFRSFVEGLAPASPE